MDFIKKIKNDKKTMTFLLSAVGLVVVIVAIIIVVSIVTGGKLSYPKLEDKLVSSAEKYFNANKNLLPQDNGEEIAIDVGTLTTAGYMKEISTYLEKDVSCLASVVVVNSNNKIAYYPKLDCGENYKQVTLHENITAEGNVVETKDGLYKYEKGYIYKGESIHNYVSFGGQTWRILSINEDGEIRLILNEVLESTAWDDRYNAEKDQNYGINDFDKSRIKELLDSYYSVESFEEKDLAKIVFKSFCAGKRSFQDNAKTVTTECDTMTEPRAFGLPYPLDYINASTSSECVTTNSKECVNYNYMIGFGRSYWTMIGYSENTYEVYYIGDNYPYLRNASGLLQPRPVTTVNRNIRFSGGTGKFDDPYIIK